MTKPILVCGDAMHDFYWFGDVTRISPEAPVPVVKITRTEERHGAARNVRSNIVALGGHTHDATCWTSKKYRIVARNQQVARVDYDDGPTDEAVAAMEAKFLECLPDSNIVVFSDYGKGSLRNIRFLINKARQAECMILVDPKGHDYAKYSGADMVKPNTDELRGMVGGWSDEIQLESKVRALMLETGIKSVLLTRASAGMTLFYDGGTFSVPAEAREVYDVTGAGDTAIAALAVALSRGFDWCESVRLANKASGIVVGKFGTSVATEKEVFG